MTITSGGEQAQLHDAASTGVESRANDRSLAGIFLTPALLIGALIALYLYVHSKTLDSIEKRPLNRAFLTTHFIQHLELTGLSTVLVILTAIPLGILLTRPAMRRASPVVLAIVNVGQAVPSIALLVLFAIWFNVGFRYAIVALVVYSFLPVLRNTMTGLQRVDRSLIDAARGMGMTKPLVLRRVELPLAVPVMMAGIRTALIINVGTATLATFTSAGGLGSVIDVGLKLDRRTVTITGAVLVAVLALAIDWLAGLAERVLRPRGI
ncbi:MAG: ABC transporter permease [Pseudonocardiales bacterium]|nr:MAG: ABC transporter permease [Pseudonocardiales bacterium]